MKKPEMFKKTQFNYTMFFSKGDWLLCSTVSLHSCKIRVCLFFWFQAGDFLTVFSVQCQELQNFCITLSLLHQHIPANYFQYFNSKF